MQEEGIEPSKYTIICLLRACGSLRSVEHGRAMHDKAHSNGLDNDPFVGSALINMYAKCCALAKAQEVFNKLSVQNVVSWTGLISGYAQLGKDAMVVKLFNKMLLENIQPNVITFTVMLNVCRHSGLNHESEIPQKFQVYS